MNVEQARLNMIEYQIRPWEVLDQGVLDSLYAVKREDFVPAAYRMLAFSDLEIPISPSARMWMPKLEARVLQELAVKPTDRILEVGTGSGYFTALLAQRAQHVYSVEIDPELKASGEASLRRAGVANATVELGDAVEGWSRHAPYDVIVLTGSTPEIPRNLLQQMRTGARLFAVVGTAPVMAARLITCTGDAVYSSIDFLETQIAPLTNAPAGERFSF
ncbi:MAG: protein-L-isoaspartate O-methyltransferase [Betaproteobacteria bacterium]|nr:MAG: protein-L-isoaspartate O-methyltransferase [Betaproteobacteria bacterium]